MRMRSLALVALLALAAGCVSSEAPVESASAPDAPLAEAATPTAIPVDFAGATGAVAFVCVPIDCVGGGAADGFVYACALLTCAGSPAPVTEGANGFEPEYEGVLDAVDLTLEWSAATPASETLTLGFGYEKEGGIEYFTETGTSPLVLKKSDLGIEPGTNVVVYAWTPCEGAVAVWLCETEPQDFTIQGTLTTLPQVASTDETAS